MTVLFAPADAKQVAICAVLAENPADRARPVRSFNASLHRGGEAF